MIKLYKAPIINGVEVPYNASIKELRRGLTAPMKDYVVCLRALAWKGNWESFEILKNELRNKDYYRRRAALENISYHRLWETSPYLVKELLLDHSEYVVKLALSLLSAFGSCDVTNEVVIAYDFWTGNQEIQALCQQYFEREHIDYYKLVWEYTNKKQKLLEHDSFYKGCSQERLIGNWNENEKMPEYFSVIHKYFPEYSYDDARLVLYKLSEDGCGYAAIVATLIHFFGNNSYCFMNTFGFSLYDYRGQSNADLLLLHFYCMTDKNNCGMTIGQMMSRFRRFTKEYQLKAKMDTLLKVKSEQLQEKDTYIIILTKNFVLLDEHRKKIYVDRWHYMNLRDIDADRNLVVSTWGKSYILRKADIEGRIYFIRIQYIEKA